MMMVLVPIDWSPLECESLLARWPSSLLFELSITTTPDALMHDTLRVIYAACAHRAPNDNELRANSVERPAFNDGQRRIMELIEAIERDEVHVESVLYAPRETESAWYWFDLDNGEQMAVRYEQRDRSSKRPEDGGWEAILETMMTIHGDDYDPIVEVAEAFRQRVSNRFMPGECFVLEETRRRPRG